MRDENELSLEQILANMEEKLRGRGKEMTPEIRKHIEEDYSRSPQVRELRRTSKKELDASLQQASLVYQAVKPSGRGGIVKSDEIISHFREAINEQLPIEFVLFIGGGEKKYGDFWDKRFKNKVCSLLQTVKTNHSAGAKLHLILVDEHIERNGYIDESGRVIESAQQYMAALATDIQTAQEKGIKVRSIKLRDLYQTYGLQSMTEERAMEMEEAKNAYWKNVGPLSSNSRRLSRTGVEPQTDSIRYVAMRQQERVILEQGFQNAILLAPGVSTGAEDFILPKNYPGIFLGGKSPWFMKGGDR